MTAREYDEVVYAEWNKSNRAGSTVTVRMAFAAVENETAVHWTHA